MLLLTPVYSPHSKRLCTLPTVRGWVLSPQWEAGCERHGRTLPRLHAKPLLRPSDIELDPTLFFIICYLNAHERFMLSIKSIELPRKMTPSSPWSRKNPNKPLRWQCSKVYLSGLFGFFLEQGEDGVVVWRRSSIFLIHNINRSCAFKEQIIKNSAETNSMFEEGFLLCRSHPAS